jgi:hypothetical protein
MRYASRVPPSMEGDMGRRGAFAVTVVAAAAVTVVAHAQPTSWQLEWSAPAGCPDVARVRDSVARLLGSNRKGDDPVSARIVVSHDGGSFHAQIDTVQRAGSGHRALEGATCQDVADASALIVALLIDPNVVASPLAPAAAGAAIPSGIAGVASAPGPEATDTAAKQGTDGAPRATTPVATAASAPSPRTEPVSSSTPDETGRRPDAAVVAPSPASARAPWFASASVALGVGTLPGLGFGLGLTLGYRFGRVRVAVDGLYWPSETSTLPNRAPAGGSVELVSGGASGCFAILRGARFDAGPCVALELGRMSATGVSLPTNAEGAAFWSAAAAGGYASLLTLRPVALSLEVFAWVPLATPRFQVMGGPGVAFEPSPVEGRTVLSVEIRF